MGGALSQVFKSLLLGPILSQGGRKVCVLVSKLNSQDLEFIIRLVEAGKIKPVIERRYSLSETVEAVRYLSEGHARGKVVITCL